MATVKKRGNKYVVISSEPDSQLPGKHKQNWETFETEDEAMVRKAEIELEKARMKLGAKATGVTVRKLLSDFIEIYGSSKWALSTYSSNKALIENYINPLIGDIDLSVINGMFADRFFRDMSKTRYIATVQKTRNTGKTLAPAMLNSINKIMRCAFNQAIRWEIVTANPFTKATLPDYHPAETKIWRSSDITSALAACGDIRLEVAINLAFACSMRAGEITGLQWSNVNVSEQSIREDDSWLYIDRELTRVSADALIALDDKDVLFKFPKILPGKKTELILKTPKTRSSIRKVWIPRTVAELLLRYRQWQLAHISKLKEIGDEYLNFDLVLTEDSGRPYQNYKKHFDKLKHSNDLPDVVFHSLRHSSTTYKLKLSGGDIKATQGDTGHAQVEMVTKVYSHILDEDRKINAQKFDEEFYNRAKRASSTSSLGDDRTSEDFSGSFRTDKRSSQPDAKLLMELLEKNPALLDDMRNLLIKNAG